MVHDSRRSLVGMTDSLGFIAELPHFLYLAPSQSLKSLCPASFLIHIPPDALYSSGPHLVPSDLFNMMNQVLRSRYIERSQILKLLRQLFGTDFLVEDRPDYYALTVPRLLTEV